MDEIDAGVVVNTALINSLMQTLLSAGVITEEQFNSVIQGAEKLLADQVPDSREESRILDKARFLMAQRKGDPS